MRIVFDEVTGTVAGPTEPAGDRGGRPSEPAPPASPYGKPVELARAMRLMAERKARLFAS